jgi:hypothetical protein
LGGAVQIPFLYTLPDPGVVERLHIHTQGVSRSVFFRLGLVLGAPGALADSIVGAQDLYFTTGLPLMNLYYPIGKYKTTLDWGTIGEQICLLTRLDF